MTLDHHRPRPVLPPEMKLGYLLFEVRHLDRWAKFCSSMQRLSDPAKPLSPATGAITRASDCE
jgi:hypothetical protein